jgi:uncharacterized protein (DUF1800 family)
MRRLPAVGVALLLAACASRGGPATYETAMRAPGPAFSWPDTDSAHVLHFLNRLSFGPGPTDIARVRQLGYRRWLDEQLQPERIADTVQDAVHRQYALAFEPPEQLWREYPPPQLAIAQARRRADAQMDPAQMRPDSMLQQRFQRAQRQLGGQVVMATLARHIASERQLQEVMTDFWFNHFNVFIGKNQDRWLTSDYVERAIREHALGRFEDLLLAVAKHPAMLVYLDNAVSVAPGSRPAPQRRGGFFLFRPFARRPRFRPQPPAAQRRGATGINENYGRELLELHTLGVDGGYTQQDVQSTARILTGWGVSPPQQGGFQFEYHEWAHDDGEKTVLGVKFPSGHGMDEGERLLRMLAAHPSTARHIAHKLCARFVADDPPDGCVDHAVAAWTRTNGDIRAVVLAIVESDDFWAPETMRAKLKSPLEFVVSALRATGAGPDTSARLGNVLNQLGQPLFMQQVPTGYPERMDEWVNSGALLNRMNVAVAIAAGRLPGMNVDLEPLIHATADKDALVAAVNAAILGGQASPNTLRVIRQQIDDVGDARNARALAVGLALGSPDFQKQ